MTPYYTDDAVTLHHGDCLDVLRELPDASVDAVVTDPPYGLEFMGREWDSFGGDARQPFRGEIQTPDNPYGRSTVRFAGASSYGARAGAMLAFQSWCTEWATECLRVLKPGGHLLAFGGTRTWHRLACAVEDAGFEIRDSIAWLQGAGFPKSRNVSRDLDSVRCQCQMGESERGASQGIDTLEQVGAPHLSSLPDRVSPLTDEAARGSTADLLPSVSREAGRRPSSDGRGPRASGLDGSESGVLHGEDDGPAQPGMERRGDLPPREGQLRRPEVRALSAGPAGHGAGGRLHHGAPPSDGPVDRQAVAAVGGREPQGPRSAEQRAVESGAVSVERGSQAGRGWPLCARCSKPEIPAGLGTALKPSFEPVVVGRKPLVGTVAANVLAHGTGALNIDACRVGDESTRRVSNAGTNGDGWGMGKVAHVNGSDAGRWPANVTLDTHTAAQLDRQSGDRPAGRPQRRLTTNVTDGTTTYGAGIGAHRLSDEPLPGYTDTGGASRFFPTFRYEAKAPTAERPRVAKEGGGNGTQNYGGYKVRCCDTCGNRFPATGPQPCDHDGWSWQEPLDRQPDTVSHPTVKPLDLMRWLVRLVTPPGAVVLDPFAGSGTTAEACVIEGFRCIAIEREADYLPLIVARLTKPIQVDLFGGEAS